MGVRRQGFALVVVLIAVAAVFALAMRGAVVARSTSLEVGAIHERVVAERKARAAVVIALAGLVPSGEGAAGSAGQGDGEVGGARVGGPGPAGEKGEGVEIPEFLKELIPELRDLEEKAKEELGQNDGVVARVSDGRGMTGRAPRAGRRARALSGLSRVGLPAGAVRVEIDGRAFRVRAWDAMGLLNVNRAEGEQLVRYFEAKGVNGPRAAALADQLMDWRDRDRVTRANGAEDEAYARMGVSCRNGEIFALEELLFLPSMDRELFESISDDLSVGGEGKIHVGTAPRAVLMSVPGMRAEVVDSVMRLRESGRLTESTLLGALPAARREAIMDRLSVRLSGILRLRVEALEGEDDRVVARFDGLAFMSERGVEEVGLRAM